MRRFPTNPRSVRRLSGANPTIAEETIGRWRTVLGKKRKTELIEFIVEIACGDQSVRQAAQSQFGLDISDSELIADTRHAIAAATAFSEREQNSNFDYDYEAYQVVERNFARLINKGKHAEVMELSVKLISGELTEAHGVFLARIGVCLKNQGPE